MKNKWLGIIVAFIITCLVTLGGIFWFDVPVYNFLHQFNWRGWEILGKIFSAKNWLVIPFLVVVVFYVRKIIQTKSKVNLFETYTKVRGSYAFWVFCSVCAASVVGLLIKCILGRARPALYSMWGLPEFEWFTSAYNYHSMPSGHTLAAFAGLVMIGMLAPRGRWFFWSLATIIGVSRVCVGAHWPSDVILGAFIGTVAAIIVKDVLSRRVNKQLNK